jgi:hypothetical protein
LHISIVAVVVPVAASGIAAATAAITADKTKAKFRGPPKISEHLIKMKSKVFKCLMQILLSERVRTQSFGKE